MAAVRAGSTRSASLATASRCGQQPAQALVDAVAEAQGPAVPLAQVEHVGVGEALGGAVGGVEVPSPACLWNTSFSYSVMLTTGTK